MSQWIQGIGGMISDRGQAKYSERIDICIYYQLEYNTLNTVHSCIYYNMFRPFVFPLMRYNHSNTNGRVCWSGDECIVFTVLCRSDNNKRYRLTDTTGWRTKIYSERNLFLCHFVPTQVPRGVAWNWIQGSALRRRHLIAWAVVRPCKMVVKLARY